MSGLDEKARSKAWNEHIGKTQEESAEEYILVVKELLKQSSNTSKDQQEKALLDQMLKALDVLN